MGSKSSKANGHHHNHSNGHVVQVATMNGTHKPGIENANSPNSQRPKVGKVSNGQAVLLRRDTPAGGLFENPPAAPAPPTSNGSSDLLFCQKPISQVESASQADFFRMLDEKIAQGAKGIAESDLED
ncbi:hypothetical protein AAVH_07168 [Aphelenchoides avenae]|nr:hypothetical protein AAVH_07168 [Aphelenchus avenae]